MDVFLYSSGRAADVTFARPTVRRVLDLDGVNVTLGACRDHAPLLADFAARGVSVILLDADCAPHGAPIDLACLAPDGSLPIDLSFEPFDDVVFDWVDAIEVLDRRLAEVGLDPWLTFDERDIPMLDFELDVAIPIPERPTIYVENRFEKDRFAYFSFDLQRLADVFRDFDFACTRPPSIEAPNLVDISGLDIVQCAKFSERCELLLGATPYPFGVTMTEANRLKPKAVCGYDPRVTGLLWDYPENPLELLPSMDSVVEFVGASLVGGAR